MPNRRSIIAGLGSSLLAAPAVLRAQQLFTAYPFRLGIAAGEPSADGFVLWTRLAPEPMSETGGMPMAPVEVEWEVASDERFRDVVAKGTAIARPELAHSVHVEVTGLQPARPYWYSFRVGRERSPRGRARTLPAAGAPLDRARFAVAGCQHYEDGLFTAHRHLAAEEVDFVYCYGDYIYEGRSAPMPVGYDGKPRRPVRLHEGQQLYSLGDYRRRYAQYKLDADLQASHAAAAWFLTFDDHEVQNNWVGDIDQDKTPPEVFALRRALAFQAYYEHMPLRARSIPRGGTMAMHRRAAIGDLVDLHLLDTRQYRSDQPCDDGFRPRCPGWADPAATVLGAVQEAWLDKGLREGSARWNAVAQQIMVMPLDRRTGDEPAEIRNMDSWGAYDASRERLLKRLSGRNAVVLTGDEHQNFAGELRLDNGRGRNAAVEFVATSISSGGDGADRRSNADEILARNPFLKYSGDRRGYLVCDVSPAEWRTAFRTIDRVTVPDGTMTTASTAIVEHGRPQLEFSL